MKSRSLYSPIQELCFSSQKMAFLSGPRQVGKTTLAKEFLKRYSQGDYINWDDSGKRRIWTRSPSQFLSSFDHRESALLIFDEIHKSRDWRTRLKGLWDTRDLPLDVVVTGSARLNVLRRAGDSLLGRYYHFRVHPFTLGELKSSRIKGPDEFMSRLQAGDFPSSSQQKTLEDLMKWSGFPEPLLKGSQRTHLLWQRTRLERLVREDLRDLSRLPDLGQVEMLASMLPEKVGSPLSVQSLREDLEVSFDAVKRWLLGLQNVYYHFQVRPYAKNVKRSLKREPKIYLYDWTEVNEEGHRFENLVACHLLKAVQFWTDTGEGNFDLYYLRTKEKREIDFLITKSNKPWLALECKVQATSLSKEVVALHKMIKCPLVQVHLRGRTLRQEKKIGLFSPWILPAEKLLALLP